MRVRALLLGVAAVTVAATGKRGREEHDPEGIYGAFATWLAMSAEETPSEQPAQSLAAVASPFASGVRLTPFDHIYSPSSLRMAPQDAPSTDANMVPLDGASTQPVFDPCLVSSEQLSSPSDTRVEPLDDNQQPSPVRMLLPPSLRMPAQNHAKLPIMPAQNLAKPPMTPRRPTREVQQGHATDAPTLKPPSLPRRPNRAISSVRDRVAGAISDVSSHAQSAVKQLREAIDALHKYVNEFQDDSAVSEALIRASGFAHEARQYAKSAHTLAETLPAKDFTRKLGDVLLDTAENLKYLAKMARRIEKDIASANAAEARLDSAGEQAGSLYDSFLMGQERAMAIGQRVTDAATMVERSLAHLDMAHTAIKDGNQDLADRHLDWTRAMTRASTVFHQS